METFCDILRAIGAGAEKPTHIMYKANLSWTVMQVYIKSLEVQGLVVSNSDQGKRLYHLSDKGFQLLSQFLTIREDLNLPNESWSYYKNSSGAKARFQDYSVSGYVLQRSYSNLTSIKYEFGRSYPATSLRG